MRIYFACLLFESSINGDSETAALTDESIRLIHADDEETAIEKANLLGKNSEQSYDNDAGERVFWKFVHVVDVQEYVEDELYDGAEVYSRLHENGSG